MEQLKLKDGDLKRGSVKLRFANEELRKEYEELKRQGRPMLVERDLLTSTIIGIKAL